MIIEMSTNKLAIVFSGVVFLSSVFPAYSVDYAQGTAEVVTSAKTKSGSITYVLARRDKYDVDIFSKEAGEPTDFQGVAQRCAAAKKQLVFAMNGAKCDKVLKPIGLLIKGLTKQKNFVWPDKIFGAVEPAAVFAIDRNNGVHIIPGKSFKAADDLANYQLAIQSGPLLISSGFMNPNITRVAEAQVRNGIGIKRNGDVVCAITDDKMSLREFALFFQELNCVDAMVLDNGENCRWYAPGRQTTGRFGEILVITGK